MIQLFLSLCSRLYQFDFVVCIVLWMKDFEQKIVVVKFSAQL